MLFGKARTPNFQTNVSVYQDRIKPVISKSLLLKANFIPTATATAKDTVTHNLVGSWPRAHWSVVFLPLVPSALLYRIVHAISEGDLSSSPTICLRLVEALWRRGQKPRRTDTAHCSRPPFVYQSLGSGEQADLEALHSASLST